MREVITRIDTYCDVCQLEADEREEVVREPATDTFTVGVMIGEGRPTPKVLDLCGPHAKIIADLKSLVDQVNQLPGDRPKVATSKAAPKLAAVRAPGISGPEYWTREVPCEVCHHQVQRNNLIQHIWNNHRSDRKPATPKVCPECGKGFTSSQGCAAHRRSDHGYDPVAEAYAGVKGYKPRKALSAGQLELAAAE
jgi:hypothetical protein